MLGKQSVFARTTYELTLLLQQNLICNTTLFVTLDDAEHMSRYYMESFRLITLLGIN